MTLQRQRWRGAMPWEDQASGVTRAWWRRMLQGDFTQYEVFGGLLIWGSSHAVLNFHSYMDRLMDWFCSQHIMMMLFLLCQCRMEGQRWDHRQRIEQKSKSMDHWKRRKLASVEIVMNHFSWSRKMSKINIEWLILQLQHCACWKPIFIWVTKRLW
jgi:hypothetical protein